MKRYSIILLIACLSIGCEDTNFRSSVPNVPVSYTLYITREHPHFIVDNGFQTMTITKSKFEREYLGYAGLLLWVGWMDITTQPTYVALIASRAASP